MQDSDLNIHGMYLTDLEGRELRVSWGAREGSSSGMTLYGDRDGEDLPFQFDLTSEHARDLAALLIRGAENVELRAKQKATA